MADQEQRREYIRKSMSYRAHIAADDGSWIYPCEIFDVSVGGARLAIYCPVETPLPRQFILKLSETGQSNRHCALAWRNGNEIGVRFVRPVHPAPHTDAAQPSAP